MSEQSLTLLTEWTPFSYDTKSMKENREMNGGKLIMKGILQKAETLNQNGRVYPRDILEREVRNYQKFIRENRALGECDHPQELQIHLDRVSHKITEMWMDGGNGYGKLMILPTPCGNIIRTLLDCGVKLGVSSRGSGNVDDRGEVSEFDMLTVDIVAKPSAPQAYPTPMYEALLMGRRGNEIQDLAESMRHDPRAQQHLKKILLGWVDGLKL